MTTIPGHNIVIQQAGVLHEATQHVKPNRPNPEQFAAQQAATVAIEKTKVQEPTSSERLAADREKEKRPQERSTKTKAKKKKMEREQKSDDTGNLLDTVA
jgi:isoaspartyl peptidase/L-asparaginase-like protein (Ntn-hydrolase superfamily)